MRQLEYIEITNFKSFGTTQRVVLGHPAVLVGPNNCGKTSVVQALALWSHAVQSWWAARRDSSAKKRTAVALNRLNITSVPIQATRTLWHNTLVRQGNKPIYFTLTVGLAGMGESGRMAMEFRNQGEDIIYTSPDQETLKNTALIEAAASLNVHLLYPMTGLDAQEPLLQPGRVDVLLGLGQTGQVLRNLCLQVYETDQGEWNRLSDLMARLFQLELNNPITNSRGEIDLTYTQRGVRDALDIAMAGRGFQQMLLVFAYLFSHKNSVLLVDEPDAHLEILRQRQMFVLLRDIAAENGGQVVMVTHAETMVNEALEHNLNLLLDGQSMNLADQKDIQNALKHFGAENYLKARSRGYVLYVEGSTDIDMLYAFARLIDHPILKIWDRQLNVYYVQDNFPDQNIETELSRVEGGFGIKPEKHFRNLESMLPNLLGLIILDGDGEKRDERDWGNLKQRFWRRYELENYFITIDLLTQYALSKLDDIHHDTILATADRLVEEKIFAGEADDFAIWKRADTQTRDLLWKTQTQRIKMSTFAEDFFRELAGATSGPMLLRKGSLNLLIPLMDAAQVDAEVAEKLDALEALFQSANPGDIP